MAEKKYPKPNLPPPIYPTPSPIFTRTATDFTKSKEKVDGKIDKR